VSPRSEESAVQNKRRRKKSLPERSARERHLLIGHLADLHEESTLGLRLVWVYVGSAADVEGAVAETLALAGLVRLVLLSPSRLVFALHTGALVGAAHEARHLETLLGHVLDVDDGLLCARVAGLRLRHEVHAGDVCPPAVVRRLYRTPRHRAKDALHPVFAARQARLTGPIALGHLFLNRAPVAALMYKHVAAGAEDHFVAQVQR
jgi:hypothetical protein